MNSLLVPYLRGTSTRGLVPSLYVSGIVVTAAFSLGEAKHLYDIGDLILFGAILVPSLALCLLPLMDARRERTPWLDPFVILALLYLLAYQVPGLVFLLDGGGSGFFARIMWVSRHDLIRSYTFTLFLALVGWTIVLGLQDAEGLTSHSSRERPIAKKPSYSTSTIVVMGTLVVVAGTYSLLRLYGGMLEFLALLSVRVASRSEGFGEGTYALIKLVDVLPYGLIWLLSPALGKRSDHFHLGRTMAWITVFIVGVLIFGRSGGRKEMALFVLQWIYIYHFLSGKSLPRVANYVVVIFVVIGVFLIGSLRSIGPYGLDVLALDNVLQVPYDRTIGLELDKLGMSAWAIDVFSGGYFGLLWGESLLVGPVLWVNSWAGFIGLGELIDFQPLSLNSYLGIWEMNDPTFTARSTSLLAEGYANFGLVGVIGFYLVCGLILRKMRKAYMDHSNVVAATLYCSLYTIVVFAVVQSGLGGMLSRILFSWLPLAVSYVVAKPFMATHFSPATEHKAVSLQ